MTRIRTRKKTKGKPKCIRKGSNSLSGPTQQKRRTFLQSLSARNPPGHAPILPAFPAEDNCVAFEFRQAKAELGLPPQIEDEKIEDEVAVTPESVDQYSIVHVKPKIGTTTSSHRHVAHRRLNFLREISCQFHQPAKTPARENGC